ncbi:MAG: HIT family protein [Proteobacteria bacterium]|nr:HIT family protein [Pseudomonadota bacterium]
MTNCVFCRIAAGEIPASMVYEDEHTLAFMDLGQVNPGHVLVAARAHVENVFGLDDELAAAIFRTTARVARASRAAFGAPGMNLFQANGTAGGQTVFHFHVHVLPRWEEDGMSLSWPVKSPPREILEGYAEKVRKALG